jgi:hypothetical protein
LTGPQLSAFDCTLTKACTFTLSGGYGLDANNKIAIVNGECGTASAAEYFGGSVNSDGDPYTTYTFSDFVPTGAQSNMDPLVCTASYSVCWGHNPGTDITAHNVPVTSTLALNGPYATDFACSVDAVCTFTLSGSGLDVNSRIYLIGSGSACGAGWALCGNGQKIFGDGYKCEEQAPTDNGDGTVTFNFGTTAAGAGTNVGVCWGESTTLSEVRVRIDKDPQDAGDNHGRICASGTTYANCVTAR